METDMDVRAVEDLRSDLQRDIKDLRVEMDQRFTKVDVEMDQRFNKVDLEFVELRRDMDVGFAEMRADMKDLQGSLIRWMLGSLLSFITLMTFLLSATKLFG